MAALILAVFAASLLGSLHCAGMCGAFCVMAVGPRDAGASHLARQSAYHTGRLVVYCTLGAAAGLLGAVVDLGGSLAGLQRAAALLAGALMIAFGLVALARMGGARIQSPALPKGIQSALALGHARALSLAPVPRAGVVGLLTGLLPCGWLYAFVFTAAGTGSAIWGVAVMAAFWMGTLPILATLGFGAKAASGLLGRNANLGTAVVVVAVGVYMAAGRMQLDPQSLMQAQIQSEAITSSSTAVAAVERVQSLDAEQMPCCAKQPAEPAQANLAKAP